MKSDADPVAPSPQLLYVGAIAHTEQDKAEMRAERTRLQELLDSYESGKIIHYDEDERGELKRDVTAERIASVRRRIDDLDRTIAERWDD